MKHLYSSTQLKRGLLALPLALMMHAGSTAQTTYSFTAAGLTGPTGPTQAQVNATYTNNSLNGLVTVSSGIQNFTVPTTGVYRVRAVGAQGGYSGGYGADIAGDFTLTAGTVLKIIVGQQGLQGTNNAPYNAGGGGGGSFIATTANVPMIVAGGGGGNGDGYTGVPVGCCLNGMQASTTTAANPYPSGFNGGTSGNGGSCSSSNAGGGAGFYGNGGQCNAGSSALSFTAGGTGGNGFLYGGTYAHGGFGGGGGHYDSGTGMRGGGGGGYSGGGGGYANTGNDAAGGGGGSYNNGANATNSISATGGNGMVIITSMSGGSSGPLSSSATFTSFGYTGSVQTLTVPACVNTITFDISGARGGSGYPLVSAGGNGGRVVGVMTVTPGQVLQINVGGVGGSASSSAGGSAGFNGGSLGALYSGSYGGGGGGGASDIRVSPYATTNRLVVAGGGGGGAYNSSTTNYDRGGHGGGTTGEAGYSNNTSGNGAGGYAGTPSTGGTGGFWSGYCTGSTGTFGAGGQAGTCTNSGGGGGGGYYGGGGGVWAGGGGGSNYAGSGVTSVVHSQGYQSSTGAISFTFGVNGSLVNTITATPTVVCAGGSVTLSSSGMTTYTWTNGSSTLSNSTSVVVTPTTGNAYTVLATNASGCVSGYSISIPVYSLPTVSINSGSICVGRTFTMVPSGAASYTYSNGSNTVSPTANSTYSVTGTSSLGCVSLPAVSSVTAVALPVLTVNSGSICNGNGFTISASGPVVTYTYSSGGSLVFPTSNTSYSVTGTNSAGCVSLPAVSSVSVLPLPTIGVNSGTACSAAGFTIIPTGAATYTLNGSQNGTSFAVSPTSNTSYTVTGTSSAGCVGTSNAISTVSVSATPTVTINSGTICTGKSFTLAPGGASTYTYLNGGPVVSPTINTSYSVTGTSAQGCVGTTTAVSNVTVNITPTVSVNSGQICQGQVFTMNPSGANTYTYSNSTSTASPGSNTSYSVVGTSAQGCVSSNTAVSNVTVNANPTITVNSGTICSGTTFTMAPTGAFAYTYSSGSSTVAPVANAVYFVTGTSALGCAGTNTAISTVTVYATPVISVNSGSICSGSSFTMSPSGAVTYTYASGGPVVSPAATGSFSVVGSSSLGCISNTAVSSVTVNITPTLAVSNGTICNGQSFTISPSGASTYTVSGGSFTVSPNSSSSYSVTGTSAQGCAGSNTAVASVVVNVLPTITVNSGTICSGESFTISPSGASTYTVSGGSFTVSPNSTNSYTVTGTSSQGCAGSNTAVASLVVNATPTLTVNSGSICSGSSFTMSPSGASTYTYSNGSAVVSPTATGSYSVTGTSSAGCISILSAVSSVTVMALPQLTVSNTRTLLCAGESNTLSVSGAATFSWGAAGTGSTLAISPTVSTSYTVTGTDANGCSNSAVTSQSVDACDGIASQNALRSNIRIFPNPNNGVFSISLGDGQQQAQIEIYSALGQQLKTLGATGETTEINLGAYDNGVYYLRVSSNGKVIAMQKVIKQ